MCYQLLALSLCFVASPRVKLGSDAHSSIFSLDAAICAGRYSFFIIIFPGFIQNINFKCEEKVGS